MIRSLPSLIGLETAAIGIFVTLAEPTTPMAPPDRQGALDL